MNATTRFRLKADHNIFLDFPDYTALVVYATGLSNSATSEEAVSLLRKAEEEVRIQFSGLQPSGHKHIASWRNAYSKFGSKPSKYLCSVESLVKRSLKDQIPAINMLVNVYNFVSIKHMIPIGGEDWDKLASDLELRRASGNEPFPVRDAAGERIENPDAGEVIWKDEQGVTCRRWNWRQCERTAITTDTQNAYFVFDALSPFGQPEISAAADDFVKILRKLSPGCEIALQWLRRATD